MEYTETGGDRPESFLLSLRLSTRKRPLIGLKRTEIQTQQMSVSEKKPMRSISDQSKEIIRSYGDFLFFIFF